MLLKPYGEYLTEYQERLAQLYDNFPLGEVILGEQAEKDFIRLFGVILRLRNILTSFDDFADGDEFPPRDLQDYKSVYQDLYSKWRTPGEDSTLINDDLVFEIELLKQVDINIDYILMLVQKYYDGHCQDKVLIADIERAIKSSYELRNKKDLIDAFIDGLDSSDDVTADWERYIAEAKQRELSAIIEEENLDEAATEAFVNKAFADGEIEASGTNITNLMNYKPSRFAPDGQYSELKDRVIARLKAFLERFKGLS